MFPKNIRENKITSLLRKTHTKKQNKTKPKKPQNKKD